MGEWEPNEAWQALRAGEASDVTPAYDGLPAVARVDGVPGGFWAVLGYDELVSAALDYRTYSNVVQLFETRRPPLECDPPEHTFYRRLLNPFFARDRIAAIEDDIRAHAAEMLDPLPADLAQDFALPFPTRVLCRLLAAPDEDWQIINAWGKRVDEVGGQTAPGSAERYAAGEEIHAYMLSLIRARRASPGDDIVSGLVHGDPDLPPLDDDALLGIVMMLLSAGHNTTASAIGNIVLRLALDPALQRRLRDDPSLIPAAVEESVRLDAPQQAMRRVANCDAELGGRRILAGDWVWLVFGAANVDPRAFECPAQFDVDRPSNRHIGFGRGIHLCIGAPLARLQIRVALEELLVRTASFELAGQVRRAEWPRLGLTSLPLRYS